VRILHLSHGGLPDWRIEKCAISASNAGHEVFFCGRPFDSYNQQAFSKVYKIDKIEMIWKLYTLSIWSIRYIKRQLKNIVRESRPDIVHAHNIYAAKMTAELGIPFVYDDHEYWPIYIKTLSESIMNYSYPKKVASKITRYNKIRLIEKWQKELVSCNPTIVTTDKMVGELKAMSNSNINKIFVVPNFPLELETKEFEEPKFHDDISSVYAGKDIQNDKGRPHRNLEGLIDIFINHDIGGLTMIGVHPFFNTPSPRITYTGYVPRQSMYREMFKHSIGLMSFKKHWSHQYKSPNKAYEYAHAGLFVICTSSFSSVIESFKGNCGVFENYAELASQLGYYRDNLEELYKKRLKSFEYARKNLVWEKYEENIFRAYQLA
jgi:glycosyltransferase involved in cell wall biosynthesis